MSRMLRGLYLLAECDNNKTCGLPLIFYILFLMKYMCHRYFLPLSSSWIRNGLTAKFCRNAWRVTFILDFCLKSYWTTMNSRYGLCKRYITLHKLKNQATQKKHRDPSWKRNSDVLDRTIQILSTEATNSFKSLSKISKLFSNALD